MTKLKKNTKTSHKTWRRLAPLKKRSSIITLTAVFAVIGVVMLGRSLAYTTNFVYYSQTDPRWANLNYPYIPGTANQSDIKISRSGCGPTSLAMVASTLSRTNLPNDVAAWYGTRFHSSAGTLQSIYPVFATDYNLNYSALGSFPTANARNAIRFVLQAQRSLVVVHAGPGYFTSSGHIMVMTGYNSKSNSYSIADPINPANNKEFSESFLLSNGNLTAAFGFSAR